MPLELLRAVLWSACKEPLDGKVVLDLCAGFQSMRAAAEERGAKYVAVDLEGARVAEGVTREAGIVLRCEGHVLAKEDGTLMGAEVQPGETAHDAAARALRKSSSINPEWIRTRVERMPRVIERKGLTLFVYDLVPPSLMQAQAATAWKRGADGGAQWIPQSRLTGPAAEVLQQELGKSRQTAGGKHRGG
jgi:hypothetical protein